MSRTTLVGSATEEPVSSDSEPKPNCKKVLFRSLSTTNLRGTTKGFSIEGTPSEEASEFTISL